MTDSWVWTWYVWTSKNSNKSFFWS